ncbi:rho family-interacting cell polarization regulator 2-like isoform X2 [Nematostella vectensis]|uniref:rho family-interacting cell polarization regulator 2-like isoform X2 n=1 Tax=Nematostella vectensis TaxID=45351 RepID=UPI0020776083|nr:rho family-interacting cell polarization regulator 2-like isoform X2 [Nematostella vectensis]
MLRLWTICLGKENGTRNPSRHSKSLRMERGYFHVENQAQRSQSFSVAAGRSIKPIPLHPAPAELERKHSQNVRRRPTGLFRSKPAVKIPRVESTLNMFTRLQSALGECAKYLQGALNSVEPKRKRLVEQRIRLLESRLHEMDDLFQLYLYEQKIREGSKNLMDALVDQGSKEGLAKCKTSFKECTERLCSLEEELESKLGIFRFKIEGLVGFGRLCSGDTYDVFIKHGFSFKWKSRCKVDREGQKWIDGEFTLPPGINDELSMRVIEMRKIQANVSVGSVVLKSRNYIKARPQSFSVPLNRTGSMKLKLTVEWRPFSGTAGENTLRSKRPQSLLSEVIFVPGSPNQDSQMSVSTSPAHSANSDRQHNSNEGLDEEEGASYKMSPAERHVPVAIIEEVPPVFERNYSFDNSIPEEPEEFRHSTSLDRALQHLIPTFQTYKDQFNEFNLMIRQLEKIEELLKKCSLSRSSISISVESALESFDFLAEDAEDTDSIPRSLKSDSSWHQDTGYNSTDDFGRDSGEELGIKAIASPLRKNQFMQETIVEASETASSSAESKIERTFDTSFKKAAKVETSFGEDGVVETSFREEANVDTSFRDTANKETSFKKTDNTCVETSFGAEEKPEITPKLEAAQGATEMASEETSFKEPDSTCVETSFGDEEKPEITPKLEAAQGANQSVEAGLAQGGKKVNSGAQGVSDAGARESDEGAADRKNMEDVAKMSRSTSPNLSSTCSSHDVTVGNKALDKVILAHLKLCEELTGFLGSFGPMKYKEMSALTKLRHQARVLELLIDLALHHDHTEEIPLEKACPGLFSNVLVCSIWQGSCKSSPLYVVAKDLKTSLEERFDSQIKQSYNRVAHSVFPTIICRILHQDPDLMDAHLEEDDVISVYQYENFLLDHSRHHLSKYIDEVAYELLISRRLLSPEKEAVLAQLKQYGEVPLTRICFSAVLSLLVDKDRHLVQAAESFLCSLMKDSDARRKAVTLATEAMEESDDRLREGACLALTVLQVRDCIAQLLYLSRCDVPNVKAAAKKALAAFGEEGAGAMKQAPFSSNAGLEGLLY